jgi:rhamnosyltransferase
MMLSFSLIIPTLNAGEQFGQVLDSIKNQTFFPSKILIIDSGSNDGTVANAEKFGCEVVKINKNEFDHGGTRQKGVSLVTDNYIVFMTQDAILADNQALEKLLKCFENIDVGAVYGRQLPSFNATPIATHARLFNYPDQSVIKTMDSISDFGFKTVFLSNSFAAYQRASLDAIGGFPYNIILGEDTYVAAKMIMAGWKVAYCSEATVFHSHNYRIKEEFKRYFDTGVFHANEPWIRDNFGQAGGEGIRFVKSEIRYLLKNNFLLIPASLMRTFAKYLGFWIGIHSKRLPKKLKRTLSMNKLFWDKTEFNDA